MRWVKAVGVSAGFVELTWRSLNRGYDGLCFTLSLAILFVLIAKPLLDAIDEGTNLARLSDPRPLPHEERK